MDANALTPEVTEALNSAVGALDASLEEAIKQASVAAEATTALENVRNDLNSVKTAAAQQAERIKEASGLLLDRLQDLGFVDGDTRSSIELRIDEEPSGAFKLAMQAIDLSLDTHASGNGVKKEASTKEADPDGWGDIRTKGA